MALVAGCCCLLLTIGEERGVLPQAPIIYLQCVATDMFCSRTLKGTWGIKAATAPTAAVARDGAAAHGAAAVAWASATAAATNSSLAI